MPRTPARTRKATPAAKSDAGDRAVRFVNNLTHTGDFAGQPFKLRPWQESIVRTLLGTIRPDGLRRYRKAFLGIPRKQGKTELAAAILLYLMLGTGRKGQHLYSASGDRAQAALIYRAAASMVEADPRLAAVCKVYHGKKRIACDPLDSFYEALSSDAPRKHGLGPSVVLFDELHVFPDRRLHDALTTGFAARTEPLSLYITTAGWDRNSICWEMWDYARKVRDGVIDDPSFLPILHELPDGADWKDEANWHSVMPALGDFCSLEFLREECRTATERPAYENTFRQLYLNQWTEQAQRWLSVADWDACAGLDESDLDGRECYAGLDLGVTGDMSALTLAFPNELGGLDIAVRFWTPENGRWRRETHNAELYRLWNKLGFLAFTGDETTDFDAIEAEIVALNERWPFRLVLADRAYASHILSRLFNVHGMPVRGIAQGPITLNEPMVRLETMLIDGSLRHTGNPVMAWNVANGVIKRTSTGLMQLDKSRDTNRIDGLASLVDAVAGTIDVADDSRSIYEDRGFLVL